MKYLLFSVFILFLSILGLTNPVRDAFHFVLSPVQFGLRQTTTDLKSAFGFFRDLDSIRRENLELREKVVELEAAVIDLKKVGEENKVLREQLGLGSTRNLEKNLIMANIMGNVDDLSGASLVIDKGARHGIKAGSNVIRGNSIVGIVKSVFSERSVVDLVTSPNVLVTVFDLSVPSKTQGLAVGQFGTSIEVRRILQNEEVNVGDVFITSGADGIFDPGFALGKVVKINQVAVESLKSAYLETFLDFSKLDKVFVILL